MMAVDLHSTDRSVLSSSSSSSSSWFFSQNKPIGTDSTSTSTTNTWSCFDSSDSGSVLSSPVESELGSTETEEESDPEEDYCAELSRQMAHYMLQDDDKHEKSWDSTGSPQSTLWSPFGSSHESPKGPSRQPSPPPVPTMIEELENMKINNHFCNYSELPSSNSNPTAEFQSKQALIDDQIRAIQLYRLKQIDHRKKLKHFQNKSRAFGGSSSNNGQKPTRPPSSTTSSSWSSSLHQTQTQTHQQQPGSCTRVVFLGGSAGSRAGSSGTGVFLPRGGIGSSPDHPRKKPGCATVLIPARVVQALKQHFDKVGGGVPSGFNGSTFPLQHEAAAAAVPGGRNRQQQSMVNKQEMGLPQEWTY